MMVESQFALTASTKWVQDVLLGTLAESIAILAVAATGFLMFSGRIPVRRATAAIIGCFVLFSAAVIAHGLVGYEHNRTFGGADDAHPQYVPSTPAPAPADPYAGASIPDQRTRDLPGR